MNEPINTTLEFTKIITEFLSNNSISIVALVLIVISKDGISNFISRLTSLSYKKGESELGMEAKEPAQVKDARELRSAEEKQNSEVKSLDVEKEEHWFSELLKAFDDGRLDDAEVIFNKYASGESDESKLVENRGVYLHFRFIRGQDNKAVSELERFSRNAVSEEFRFVYLEWLSLCHKESMQYEKEVALWRLAVDKMDSEYLKTRALVNLAAALIREKPSIEARNLMVERLSITVDDKQKAILYKTLSEIEKSFGNKLISVYCSDKSLEFEPNDRDAIFKSAYYSSDEGVDSLTVSNYTRLIRIDGGDSTAINNLGAHAQKVGIDTVAVEQYKRSSKFNNTLAMANQGYLLLGAGFTDEAEEIAKLALEKDDTHKNVHSLIVEINKRKEKQRKEWKVIEEKSIEKQKQIRMYTEQYYCGDSVSLEGGWFSKGIFPVNIDVDGSVVSANWVERGSALNGNTFSVNLKGVITGSTISGRYIRKQNKSGNKSILGVGRDTDQEVIGYLTIDKKEVIFISMDSKENSRLFLSRQENG